MSNKRASIIELYRAALDKKKRLRHAKILLNKMMTGAGTSEITFSDEKLFTVRAF